MIQDVAPKHNITADQPNQFRTLWNLGYTRLVPVVPPDAELSERSSLAARLRAGADSRGKAPGVRTKDGTWKGLQFVAMESTEADLDVWHEMGASTGVKTGEGLIAVDIDTADKTAAQRIYEIAAQTLGDAAVRFGRKPKCLMLYEAPRDTPYRQVRFRTDTEQEARVEILSEGRQFVAAGIHPATGKPYAWPRGIPRREALTRITEQQLDAFLTAVAEAMPEGQIASASTAEAPDQENLKAPTYEALRQTVEAIPNTQALFPTREDYVRMAYAIKAAAPDGYELEAQELYLDWCERWESEEDHNDPDVALADWHRAKPPFRVGYEFLQNHAPALFFEPAGQADPLDMFLPQPETPAHQGLQILSVAQVMEMRPPRFLIDRHLPQTGFGLLYGDPGCGKSFLALDMALHVAYGLDTWHGDTIDAEHRRVLYIAGEGASGFQSRIQAWQALHAEEIQGKDCQAGFLFQSINFMKPEDIKRLLAAVKALDSNWAMIVVDTVSRAIPGADENLQKDMTIFVHACDALRDATGAFVLGVHHTAKAGTMRGSSVFLGQADVVLRLTRQKGASVGRLDCEKQKDAPDGWGDPYRLSVVETASGGQSLVPVRLSDGTPDRGSVDVALQNMMLRAADAAWRSGEPWSQNAQAGDRYAIRVLSRDFGVSGEQASALIDIWLGQRILVSEIVDKRTKKKGLKVAAFISENPDDVSEDEGIFG